MVFCGPLLKKPLTEDTMVHRGCAVFSITLSSCCNVLLHITSSRGSKSVHSTEPAFFISLFTFSETDDLMLLIGKLHSPQLTYQRYTTSCCQRWRSKSFLKKYSILSLPANSREQYCIFSPVRCPDEHPRVCMSLPPPPVLQGSI